MFTGPIDPRLFAASPIPLGSGKKLSANETNFESVLRNSRLKMLETLINPNPRGRIESLVINPLMGHKWVLNWVLETRIKSRLSDRNSPTQTVFIDEAGQVPKNKIQSETSVRLSIPDLVARSARKHGIPEGLFHKMIETESGFNTSAKSSKGAMGLGQLMPSTAKELGLTLSTRGEQGSVWDPESNLDASAKYFEKLFRMYRGRGIEEGEAWKFAAGAYNAGMGNIQKAIDRTGITHRLNWKSVAKHLPEITGRRSRETLRYVSRLTT